MMEFILHGIFWVLALYGLFELVKDIITAENRAAAGATAPAKGLFLTDVFYDFNEL